MNTDGIFSFLPKILGTFIQRKIEEKEQELVKRKESIQEQENEV